MNKICNMVDFLINYSCDIKKDDVVYISFFGDKNTFLECLIKKLEDMQVQYILRESSNKILSKELEDITIEKATLMAAKEVELLKKSKVHISLLAEEMYIDEKYSKQYLIYQNYYKKVVRDARLKYCRWIGLRLPTIEMAKVAGMSFKEFEKLYYEACSVDYCKLEKDHEKLAYELEEADKIKLITPTTELIFSKKGIPSKILCGKINLPDGEIYTAPHKYSINGKVKFNTTSMQAGVRFQDVELIFNDGKIVDAKSNDTSKLINILNSDEGSRYIGEFAIGINQNIKEPIGIILFDEKIKGTVHFAIGQSYKDAYNGNDSCVHWDLVLNMNKNAGGGKIFFDGGLIFEDGKWLI